MLLVWALLLVTMMMMMVGKHQLRHCRVQLGLHNSPFPISEVEQRENKIECDSDRTTKQAKVAQSIRLCFFLASHRSEEKFGRKTANCQIGLPNWTEEQRWSSS